MSDIRKTDKGYVSRESIWHELEAVSSLKDLAVLAQSLQTRYGENAPLTIYRGWGDGDSEAEVEATRTAAEYEAQTIESELRRREHERRLYERLKQQFEGETK